MRTIFTFLLVVILLSGCVPMAMFASSGGSAYRGLGTSMGTFVQSRHVNAVCLTPKMRLAIWEFEGHFGRKVVMSSGYRDNNHNRAAGGADNSYHTKCMAADFYVPGIPKERLIAFAMRTSVVGGLGCYPGRSFIHVDVRERPRGYNRPVTFNGC